MGHLFLKMCHRKKDKAIYSHGFRTWCRKSIAMVFSNMYILAMQVMGHPYFKFASNCLCDTEALK